MGIENRGRFFRRGSVVLFASLVNFIQTSPLVPRPALNFVAFGTSYCLYCASQSESLILVSAGSSGPIESLTHCTEYLKPRSDRNTSAPVYNS